MLIPSFHKQCYSLFIPLMHQNFKTKPFHISVVYVDVTICVLHIQFYLCCITFNHVYVSLVCTIFPVNFKSFKLEYINKMLPLLAAVQYVCLNVSFQEFLP